MQLTLTRTLGKQTPMHPAQDTAPSVQTDVPGQISGWTWLPGLMRQAGQLGRTPVRTEL